MSALPASFYAQWRLRHGTAAILQDDTDSPPERLLQAIWQHQRLQRDQLTTLDGKRVRVLHPGFGNAESGPDFRDALIRIGDDPPRSGDVEVDLRASGWRAHSHHVNPSFKKVILHVVWEADRAVGGLPLLCLRPFLDAPLGELSLWLEREPAKLLPQSLQGKCSAPLQGLAKDQLLELLRQAADVRFQAKAAQMQARARQVGWEQSLWEGVFRGLGYKHNVWPMQGLAEMRGRWLKDEVPLVCLQARLLGLSGLLPPELSQAQTNAAYLRRVWDHWWRERDEFEDCTLPRPLWRLHGLRPANHPQRRLALIAHWISAGNLVARIERWCANSYADRALLSSLHEILQVKHDEFWSWHWTFRSMRLKQAQPLLGATRVTDLAVNVILPWLWTRASGGEHQTLQREMERRYHAWPAAEDNAVLRLARQRLLGGSAPGTLPGAAAQQGLLQIVRDFCDHSNAICENCTFPELVHEFASQSRSRIESPNAE